MGRLRQYSQRPYDDSLGHQTSDFLDWVQSTLNALVQQNLSGSGFPALSQPTVDPTTSQIKSLGGRMVSLTSGFTFTATTTSVTMYWDGTNSSVLLRVYRDDGTIDGPFSGNQLVTGLNANTQYFFYPYFDETTRTVQFVTLSGVAVGSPPVAYTATTILAAQQQILRGRIPLAGNLSVTGITTPAAGTTPATKLGGGGGSGGAYLGQKLS